MSKRKYLGGQGVLDTILPINIIVYSSTVAVVPVMASIAKKKHTLYLLKTN